MNILILGRGVSGKGAAELAEHLGYSYTFANDGDSPYWEQFDLCVTSPGFAADAPLIVAAQEHNIELISEMEFGFRYFPNPILAITGTNGKTTTTELSCTLLKSVGVNACCAGNIGLPLSSLCAAVLKGEVPSDTVAVLEVSSFQLEHIDRFSPFASCLTNLASDHLNRYHDSSAEYKEVKMRIFNGVESSRCFYGPAMKEKNPHSPVSVSGNIISYAGTEFADFSRCALKGRHNLENIFCALNLCSSLLDKFKMLDNKLVEALERFTSGEHRVEMFQISLNGMDFTAVDDSKATNPHSVAAACRTFEPACANLRIILGGLDKDMDFTELLDCVPFFAKCYLIGEAEDKLFAVLASHVECQKFGRDFELCCQTIKKEAKEGDILILSPACASMDMFKDYAHRGDRFKELMRS